MSYSDFPFLVKKGRDARRFPVHREAFLYLKDFFEWFGLREFMRFNTKVEYVGMADCVEFGKELKWVVKSKEKDSDNDLVEEVFDAVVVATGHSQPRLAAIKGMDMWRGRQMHSHVYRVPEPLQNEVVVVVGSSLSGQDIAVELVGVATQIYIDYVQDDGWVVFVDGSCDSADTIIYCAHWSVKEFYHSMDLFGIPNHYTHDNANFEITVDPHTWEEWRTKLYISLVNNAVKKLDMYRHSYDDHELIQAVYQSPYFTQLEAEAFNSSVN
ncbi:hypothetical protein LguiA_028281 [Lonicera macranthoides]